MTPYEVVIDKFMKKILQDKEYFCIDGATEEQLIGILNEKGKMLLEDAIYELQPMINQTQNVNFIDVDDIMEQFNIELTRTDIDIISDMMVVKYFDEGLIKVKALQKYLGDDIKIFSPNAERKTYMEMVSYKRALFLKKLANYNTVDRLTGKFLL